MGFDGEDMSIDEGEHANESSTEEKKKAIPETVGGAPVGGTSFSSFTGFVFGTSVGEGDEEEEKLSDHRRDIPKHQEEQPPHVRREREMNTLPHSSSNGSPTNGAAKNSFMFLNSVFGTSTGDDDEEIKDSNAHDQYQQAQQQKPTPLFPFNEPNNVSFNIGTGTVKGSSSSNTATKKKSPLKPNANKATPKKKDSHSSSDGSRDNSAEKPPQSSDSFVQGNNLFAADATANVNSFFPNGSTVFSNSSNSSSTAAKSAQSFSTTGDEPPSWWFNPGGKSNSNTGSTKKAASGKQRGRVNKVKRSGISSSISSQSVNTPSSPSPSSSDGDVAKEVSEEEDDNNNEDDEHSAHSTANLTAKTSQKPNIFFDSIPKPEDENDFYREATSSLDENSNPLPQKPNAVPEYPTHDHAKRPTNSSLPSNVSKSSTRVPISSSFSRSTSADDPPRQHHNICDMAERYSQQGKECYSAGSFILHRLCSDCKLALGLVNYCVFTFRQLREVDRLFQQGPANGSERKLARYCTRIRKQSRFIPHARQVR